MRHSLTNYILACCAVQSRAEGGNIVDRSNDISQKRDCDRSIWGPALSWIKLTCILPQPARIRTFIVSDVLHILKHNLLADEAIVRDRGP